MKVLHIVPSLGLQHGGVSVSVRELCRGLARIGVDVEVWTTRRGHVANIDGLADQVLSSAGVRIRYFPVHPWKWFGERYAYSPSLGASLRDGVPKFDLVHIHALWLHPTAAGARACRRFGIPYIVSPCGALDPYSLSIHRILKWFYMACLEHKTLKGASALHFTSAMEREKSRVFGITRATATIPRSIEARDLPNPQSGTFRKRHPQIGQNHVLLFLGRLHSKKRLDLVVETFVRVAQRRSDVHLVVAGPDSPEGLKARDILHRAGLLDRTTFPGMLAGPDKWAAFRDSTLFLLPSEDENFGVAALEAMAMGIPILLSRHVGLAETAAAGKAGIILDQDSTIWATAIEQLLEDPVRRQSMGEAGRRLAETDFSSRRVAAAMRNLYVSLLNKAESEKKPLHKTQAHLAKTIYWLANTLLGLIRTCLWPRQRPPQARHLCIYRIGNIGDIVCAIPAMVSIRQAYPNAHITLLTSPGKEGMPGAKELLAGAEWLDDLMVYHTHDINTLRKRMDLVNRLRRKTFDVWMELPNDLATVRVSLRNMLAARLAGARWAYGWRINTIRWATQAQSEYLSFPNEVERLLTVVKEAGIHALNPSFPLPIQPQHQRAVDSLLEKYELLSKPLAVIAPGAKRPLNHWRAERFSEVGRHLVRKGIHAVVLGGTADANLCQKVSDGIGEGGISLAGKLSLLEVCELLKRCCVVIGVDSGIQHLAAAAGTPCISLFSFWQLRGKWRPYGSNHTVLQKWVGCHTCYLEICPYDNRCINLIETREVNAAIDQMLDSKV